MPQIPDRLHIDRDDRELYDKLQTDSLFASTERKEQFLIAMAFGFKGKTRRQLENKETSGFFRTSYLRPEDEALINAVAICDTGSVDVLVDRAEVFRIAEEYAHAGIRILVNEWQSTQFASYAKRFEKDLFDMYNSIHSERQEDEDTSG